MPIIDCHTHVFAHRAESAVEVMDRCGIQTSLTMEWHNGFGDALREHIGQFNRFPGRFVVFGNVDWRRVNEPRFGQHAAEQMARDADSGMRGLKIFKALGLEYRRPDGQLWRVNAPEFDPIWEQAGKLGLPVLMHTADPPAFWQSVDERNFWNAVIFGQYEWWSYYRKGLPSPEELLSERNQVIARHPSTTFICPHLGSKSEMPLEAADDLAALPNLYYDISARVPALGSSPLRAQQSRQFMLDHPDRVLFGTDCIYDDDYLPRGQQAQNLQQPGPAMPAQQAHASFIEQSEACVRMHLDFLTGTGIQENPPIVQCRQGYKVWNLNLPAAAAEKILHGNVQRLLGTS